MCEICGVMPTVWDYENSRLNPNFGSPFCKDCVSKLRELLGVKEVGRYATDILNETIEAKRNR